MYRLKMAKPAALSGGLAMILTVACGGNGTVTRQTLIPAAASDLGDAAASLDVSGEYSGSVNDSVFGAGRAAIELSQYRKAAGGIMTLTFGSTALITPVSYVANGRSLNGADNYQISASSGVCAFTETATYKDGQLKGAYRGVDRCSSDQGTFTVKETCRFSNGTGANFTLKTC